MFVIKTKVCCFLGYLMVFVLCLGHLGAAEKLAGSSEFPVTHDSDPANWAARPEIEDGTFYLNGRPVFLVGPFLDSFYNCGNGSFPIEKLSKGDREILEKLGMRSFELEKYKKSPIYNRYFDEEVARIVGFNTAHPPVPTYYTAEKLAPNAPRLKAPAFKRIKNNFPKSIANMGNLPLVVDYAKIGLSSTLSWTQRKVLPFPEEVYQQTSMGFWRFVPFCPEHPTGSEIYRTYWQDGARIMLESGGNPWIYELFNEPAYDCRCSFNKKEFLRRVRGKYGSIEKVNVTWGSDFKSFGDLIKSDVFERQKGLYVEWCKFLGDRWTEILLEGKSAIREIDQREKVYFSNQRGIAASFLTTANGYDEYKIARVMDVVNTEGGVHFYVGAPKEEDNPMAAHLRGTSRMALDMCRAAAEGKPVIDSEFSTARFDEKKKRIPTLRGDFSLSLWNEVIHGASLTIFYAWGKRSWEWEKSLEGAYEFVHRDTRKWRASHMLIPTNYPIESFKGIQDFNREIDRLAEVVLPTPRIEGRVGLLLSNPSRCYTHDIRYQFEKFYRALESIHMPLDVVFEEQINNGWASRYEAIISPFAEYIYPETLDNLRDYVRGGGNLILRGMDMAWNEYGISLGANGLIGFEKRAKMSNMIPAKFKLSIPHTEGSPDVFSMSLDTVIKTVPETEVLAEFRGLPVLTLAGMGNGRVYYIAGEMKSSDLPGLLASLLADANISAPFRIRRARGGQLPQVEAQVITRESKRLFYFANWSRLSELGVVDDFENLSGHYYVSDPVRGRVCLSPSGSSKWSTAELDKGIKVFLPGEERTLLLLSRMRPNWAKGEADTSLIINEYEDRRARDEKIEKEMKERIRKAALDYKKRNRYDGVDTSATFFIDITGHCNMGFSDKAGGDKKGGAFDQGNNDLRQFPVGTRKFSGVPFKILDPADNEGKSIIVLRGEARNYFPDSVKGIKVDAKAKCLYFLHTAAWSGGHFAYVVNYEDGSSVEVPIRHGKDIADWHRPGNLENAKIAWKGSNPKASGIAVYCYRWENPMPEKIINTIDVVTFEGQSIVPSILAITGEK